MVAFDGSAETALNVLSVALSGSKKPSGWLFSLCHRTGCRCHLNCSGRRNFAAFFRHGRFAHVSDFHRAGDHFFRRHGLTDTADPATEHIHRAIWETDFIGPHIPAFKPAYKPFLTFFSRFPGQRKTGISCRLLPCPVAVQSASSSSGGYHRRVLPSSRPASDPSP